jgi:molybdenum cofactor cytidylyltransferase
MTANSNPKVGGILLAAGGSSRLGRPKQLLKFEGKTLIRRASETLVRSACEPFVVVLGAEFENSNAEIADLGINVCVNELWQTGMSSSIKVGLQELLKFEPNLDAVVIMLCDQPYITAIHIDALIDRFHETESAVVAAKYGDTFGVPALFSRKLFPRLLELSGDQGARLLIRSQSDQVESVTIPEAAFDIDTPEDLARETS